MLPHLQGLLAQNVRGLGNSATGRAKVQGVINGVAGDDVSIVILTETKLTRMKHTQQVVRWANEAGESQWFGRHAVKGSNSGSGVSILFRSELSPFMANCSMFQGHAVHQEICSAADTGHRIHVFVIYIPHGQGSCAWSDQLGIHPCYLLQHWKQNTV